MTENDRPECGVGESPSEQHRAAMPRGKRDGAPAAARGEAEQRGEELYDIDERSELLLQWAAQVRLARRVASIADFAERPLLILDEDGAQKVASLASLAIDPKSAAILFREAYGAHVGRLAENRKTLLRWRFGVTEAEFAQALRDFEMLAASAGAAPAGTARRRRNEDHESEGGDGGRI